LRVPQVVHDGRKPKADLPCLQDIRRQPKIYKRQMRMTKTNYPLHPNQTHAAPLYTQLPLEEYEAIMKENARMKEALKRHGITLLDKEND